MSFLGRFVVNQHATGKYEGTNHNNKRHNDAFDGGNCSCFLVDVYAETIAKE